MILNKCLSCVLPRVVVVVVVVVDRVIIILDLALGRGWQGPSQFTVHRITMHYSFALQASPSLSFHVLLRCYMHYIYNPLGYPAGNLWPALSNRIVASVPIVSYRERVWVPPNQVPVRCPIIHSTLPGFLIGCPSVLRIP